MTSINQAATTSATPNSNGPLYQLAALLGIETSYMDVQSVRRDASPDSLLAILPLLGANVSRMSDVPAALDELRTKLSQQVIEPVHVVWNRGTTHVQLNFPAALAQRSFRWRITLENGEVLDGECQRETLARCPHATSGLKTTSVRLFPLPRELPFGYHSLSLAIGDQQYDSLIISAPSRAFTPTGSGWTRCWGLFAPLYALRSERNWGAGDFRDLKTFNRWAVQQGCHFVGTLPLHPAFMNEIWEISPYSPVSRLFWNEFYLHLEDIPELAICPEARRLLSSTALRAEIDALRAAPLVDYRRLITLKRQVLERLAESFFAHDSKRRDEFTQYTSTNPHVVDYAMFRAIGERKGAPSSQWPQRLQDGRVHATDYSPHARQYHMFVQWLAKDQMEAAAASDSQAGLYLDLPLGVHRDGYDVWRERSSFATGISGGCPPDVVFPAGQNWGFVPLHPRGIRETGYRYVRQFVQHVLQHAAVLRIDHMPSFHRVFWIPEDRPATQGVYVRYPSEELYALFCLESHRHSAMLVGEDLGTVPPEVPAAMAQHNFHRMHVIQYELKPDPIAPLPDPPAGSLSMINTHDMPPFAGFWQGRDIEERAAAQILPRDKIGEERAARQLLRSSLQQYLITSETVSTDASADEMFSALLAHLRDGPSRLLLINLEDLWQETESQNIPSTSHESPNWRRKMRQSFEEFSENAQLLKLLSDVNKGFR